MTDAKSQQLTWVDDSLMGYVNVDREYNLFLGK